MSSDLVFTLENRAPLWQGTSHLGPVSRVLSFAWKVKVKICRLHIQTKDFWTKSVVLKYPKCKDQSSSTFTFKVLDFENILISV